MLQGTPHAFRCYQLRAAWFALLRKQPFDKALFIVENLPCELDARWSDALRVPAGEGPFVDVEKVCGFLPGQEFCRDVWQTKPPKSGVVLILANENPRLLGLGRTGLRFSVIAVAHDLHLGFRIWLGSSLPRFAA